MIDGLTRRFRKSFDKGPWDADRRLKPELGDNAELPNDVAVIAASTRTSGEFSPIGENAPDYYKSLIATAIKNGGRLGDHQISVPWLRMILAGLELKHIEPEMMWYGVESASSTREPLRKIPSYSVLFPSEQDVPTGLGPG